MRTHDSNGYVESGAVYFQLKSSDNFVESGGILSFDLDIRDYNLWRAEVMPVVLILFDAISTEGLLARHPAILSRESVSPTSARGEDRSRPPQSTTSGQPACDPTDEKTQSGESADLARRG